MRRWRMVILFALFANLSCAFAHEMRPAYLELTEVAPGEFSVVWKTPMVGDARLALSPEFSGDVQPVTPVMTRTPVGAAVQTWTLRATELRGQTLRIRGLDSTMTDTLVRFSYADGTTWTQLLKPQQPSAVIPARQSGWSVAGEYLNMGVEHILLGIDHLLFVLALLLIVAGWKRLLATITAFTLAHSVTLAAATLGFVNVPQAPVEALIALSIVFVAAEILRQRSAFPTLPKGGRGDFATVRQTQIPLDPPFSKGEVESGSEGTLTARAPWIVAFIFGLLHGFGFAGALAEIGLPEGHIPQALLFFNVGVELGQLLFIAAVLSFIAALRRIRFRFPGWAAQVPPYAIGSLAMFWVIQRVAAF